MYRFCEVLTYYLQQLRIVIYHYQKMREIKKGIFSLKNILIYIILFFLLLTISACGVPSQANLGTPEDDTQEYDDHSSNHEKDDENNKEDEES